VEIGAVRHDDVGALIAVLGLDQPREDLDALSTTAFEAAVGKLG